MSVGVGVMVRVICVSFDLDLTPNTMLSLTSPLYAGGGICHAYVTIHDALLDLTPTRSPTMTSSNTFMRPVRVTVRVRVGVDVGDPGQG